ADTDVEEAAEGSAGDEPAIEAASFAHGEWAGSMLPDADGNGPDTHPIKGNADSMLYHTPESRYYKVTKAEVWFDTEENAEAAGFSKPGTKKDED
ncbi:MAG: 50S ribosomal protein L17, partial [Ilumatobacteraceae bacterium]